MNIKHLKEMDFSQIDVKKIGIIAATVVLFALIIALCVTVNMRSNIQSEYTDMRNEIGEVLYTNLYMFCQTFDQVTVPGAEVQNVIIPSMSDYFLAAKTLNTVLLHASGERYAVLDDATLTSVANAFNAYDVAFRTGRSTQEAQDSMLRCVENIRSILDNRYRSGSLLPTR